MEQILTSGSEFFTNIRILNSFLLLSIVNNTKLKKSVGWHLSGSGNRDMRSDLSLQLVA